jgi:ABC-type branched-subunit amino acid transport system permease subunit
VIQSSPGQQVNNDTRHMRVAFGVLLAVGFIIAPVIVYPVFLMKVMCFALFACAFNLLIGFGGLLSFGHAMFLGTAGYAAAHSAKVWGFTPELASCSRPLRGACSRSSPARWPSAARASTSR